jgi:hypothetical protein
MNLHCAVYDGDLSLVRTHIDNYNGNPAIKSLALVLAAATNKSEIVQAFLKSGVNTNKADHFFGLQRKWESIPIKTLHEHWQWRLMPFSHNWTPRLTPLCAAAFFGHAKIVQMLLDAGADIDFDPYFDEEDYENRPAWNALTCALLGGNEFVARYLMYMGAHASNLPEAAKPMAALLLKKYRQLPLEMIEHTLSYM